MDETITEKLWDEILPLHPAAELFPELSLFELHELAADIKANGLQTDIVLTHDGTQLLDGRSRLNAMGDAELPIFKPDGVTLAVRHRRLRPDDDPYAVLLSLNIRRRHLKPRQKRALIEKLRKVKPEWTDRQIAKATQTSHPTVAKVRRSEAAEA